MGVKTSWVTYIDQHEVWAPDTLKTLLQACRNVSFCALDKDKEEVFGEDAQWRTAPVLHRLDLAHKEGFLGVVDIALSYRSSKDLLES